MRPALVRRGSMLVFLITVALMTVAGQDATGYLKVKTNLGRTGVFVDGKYLGPSANFKVTRKYTLPPGKHELALKESNSEDFNTTVEITAGKTTMVKQDMKPLPPIQPPFGTLKIRDFDKYAAVYVNGKFVGHADEFNNFAQGLLLNPGSYEVRVEPKDGGSPTVEKVTIEKDKTVVVAKK